MATSIQQVGDKVAMFDDLDLIALIGLLARGGLRASPPHGSPPPLVAEWQRSLETYGPGTIDLRLDAAVSRPRAISELLALLATLEDDLARAGPTVPAAILNEGCRAPGVRFSEVPGAALVAAIQRLRQLIA